MLNNLRIRESLREAKGGWQLLVYVIGLFRDPKINHDYSFCVEIYLV